MTKVTVDRATLGRLRATLGRLRDLQEPLELCDESGRVLGTFTPAAGAPPGPGGAGRREPTRAPN